MVDNNRMYCYVCWYEDRYGVYPPEVMFWYEIKAKEWVGENKLRKYKKMQIH